MPASLSESTRPLRSQESPVSRTRAGSDHEPDEATTPIEGTVASLLPAPLPAAAPAHVRRSSSGERPSPPRHSSDQPLTPRSKRPMSDDVSQDPPFPAVPAPCAEKVRRGRRRSRTQEQPARADAPPSLIDPEKVSPRGSTCIPAPLRSPSHISFGTEADEPADAAADGSEARLGLILIHLSFANPLLALITTIYALVATLLTLLAAPLALVATRPPLGTRLFVALAPPLRWHLRLAGCGARLRESASAAAPGPVAPLLAVSLLNPLVAAGVMLAAWTAGIFWGFAAIVGDPNAGDGSDGRPGVEGRSAVRWVRRAWAGWVGWGAAV